MNNLKTIICTIALSLLTSLSIANAQSDLNSPSPAAQGLLKFINDPQNKNVLSNNVEYQNHTELVMSIMKAIEDKHITEINKKIEFVNSFEASDDIKQQVISYINQNITYSDNEKVAYGIYLLKKCNDDSHKKSSCIVDYMPTSSGCQPDRSNVCCQ